MMYLKFENLIFSDFITNVYYNITIFSHVFLQIFLIATVGKKILTPVYFSTGEFWIVGFLVYG